MGIRPSVFKLKLCIGIDPENPGQSDSKELHS